MEFVLSDEEKVILLQTARKSIESRLLGPAGSSNEESSHISPNLKSKCGVFVSLHEHGTLRGCIGYLSSEKALVDTVSDAARASAFQDMRFTPLQKGEEKKIDIEISVLSPLREIKSVEEIKVGTHGILIEKDYRSGLLLPQVAVEYQWDRETFLVNTCNKAGLSGDCWKNQDTVIKIFNAIVFGEKDLL